MGVIIPFPPKKEISGEAQFITVLKTEDVHIMWNRSQLFFIKECSYPITQHVLSYVTITSRGRAQKVAQMILNNLRRDNKGLADYDQTKGDTRQ